MELWLDAASARKGPLEPHPADRVLLATGDSIPDWIDSVLFACDDGRILDNSTHPVGVHVDIGDSEGQEAAKALIGMVSWVVLTTGDWQMIPLENLVAASQGSGTKLVARIDSNQAVRGAAFALETGVDALLLPPNDAEIWTSAQMIAAERLASRSKGEEILEQDSILVAAEVTAIEDGGFGDRACVDLTTILDIGQGLLVGSSSSALSLIHGETLESEFVPPRPFRVNAGAVHAYVLMADGTTKYLSELVAGDTVAIVDSYGATGEAIVGRIKIESRPFLIIRFKHEESGTEGQTFVQQAETVRLISPDGQMPSVTSLKTGDSILVHVDSSARHIGQNVLSASEER